MGGLRERERERKGEKREEEREENGGEREKERKEGKEGWREEGKHLARVKVEFQSWGTPSYF
jgi:hypothetical protein